MKRQPRATPKKLDYPGTTAGSRLAAKARKLASKLTAEQRREHLNGAMAMIYGGAKEAVHPVHLKPSETSAACFALNRGVLEAGSHLNILHLVAP